MCSVQQGDSPSVFISVMYVQQPHIGLYTNKLDEHLGTCGLLKPDDAKIRALLNLVENHSLKIIKHGATQRTRTTTTISDTHIAVILVDAQPDRLLNFDEFPAPYARNRHDVITATISRAFYLSVQLSQL